MLIFTLLLSLGVHAGTAKIDFIANTNVPGVSVEGTASKVAVTNNVVELDVFDLATGMEKRDAHLREKVFAAKKVGDAKIRFEVVELGDAQLKGKLKIKDVEREISMPVTRSGGTVTGQTKIALSDFSLPRPSFMGVKVEETVDVSFKVTE